MSGSPDHLSPSIIDEEHRGIEREIVNLMEALLLGASSAKVEETAMEVLRANLTHFENEEAILKAAGFEKLEEHRAEHATIAGVLKRIVEELKNKESVVALRSLREYRRLLLVHLQDEDERYREAVNRYAAEQGRPPLPPRIRHALPET